MPHTFKGQSAKQYRPSATRRPSGLSRISESSEKSVQLWNKLRQAIARSSQEMRVRRTRNRDLLARVRRLDSARNKVNAFHKAQMKRLENQARNLGALHDKNYINAKKLALRVYKKALANLHDERNNVVRELIRNSTSSNIRRRLYAEGLNRGRHGTSENNWQNWTEKLWHKTERAAQVEQFFRPKKTNQSPR